MVTIRAERFSHDARDAAADTLTVAELINELRTYNGDTPVIISNDNGFTFGRIWAGFIREVSE